MQHEAQTLTWLILAIWIPAGSQIIKSCKVFRRTILQQTFSESKTALWHATQAFSYETHRGHGTVSLPMCGFRQPTNNHNSSPETEFIVRKITGMAAMAPNTLSGWPKIDNVRKANEKVETMEMKTKLTLEECKKRKWGRIWERYATLCREDENIINRKKKTQCYISMFNSIQYCPSIYRHTSRQNPDLVTW